MVVVYQQCVAITTPCYHSFFSQHSKLVAPAHGGSFAPSPYPAPSLVPLHIHCSIAHLSINLLMLAFMGVVNGTHHVHDPGTSPWTIPPTTHVPDPRRQVTDTRTRKSGKQRSCYCISSRSVVRVSCEQHVECGNANNRDPVATACPTTLEDCYLSVKPCKKN